jgi:hypothetical protein
MMGYLAMRKYNLCEFIKKADFKNGSCDLVTRPMGQGIRAFLEREIEKEQGGSVISLDFSEIGVIDYSCADEIVAKLISRLLSGEYGDKYILLTGLNDNQRENIEVALEKKDLAVIAETGEGVMVVLGSLNNYLRETLSMVLQRGELTARQLSETMSLEMNTSETRLLNLHKKRLVRRTDDTRNGGRVLIYGKI